MGDVLVLGGYGNFGKRIADALVRHDVAVIIAGRDARRAEELRARIKAAQPRAKICAVALDAERDLKNYLKKFQPAVVINACGPYQNRNYAIAEVCIDQKTHYVDLADGREFVTGITQLDRAAKAAGVSVISGASTVPGLSSAVIDHYRPCFAQMDELVFGISPGQKAERGLATTAGILTYIGKRLKPVPGDRKPRYGWQDIYRQGYPELGPRWMANCDIPDLDLFPDHYDIQKIQFSAGMENPLLHFGIWALGWLVRLGLPLKLSKHAGFLLRASHWFDAFGTEDGGMHVIITGKNHKGEFQECRWFIIAKNGDGPQIPAVPAIVLARKLASGSMMPAGATPCLGLVSLEEYLNELSQFEVSVHTTMSP